jgi:hypothetical protein
LQRLRARSTSSRLNKPVTKRSLSILRPLKRDTDKKTQIFKGELTLKVPRTWTWVLPLKTLNRRSVSEKTRSSK